MNIQISQLRPNSIAEFSALIRIFEEVFEWKNFIMPSFSHYEKLLANPAFLVFVAKERDKIVGGLTVHILQKYDTEKPSAYIYDLAVITVLQRKGIGRLLIAAVIDYCKKNGFDEAFVQAETEDLQAVNFYRTTPFSEELQATHFTYTF